MTIYDEYSALTSSLISSPYAYYNGSILHLILDFVHLWMNGFIALLHIMYRDCIRIRFLDYSFYFYCSVTCNMGNKYEESNYYHLYNIMSSNFMK